MNPTTTGRDRYLAERIETASPQQLIKMLLDRALAELELATTDLGAGNRPAAAPRLAKAQAIVNELRCSLDLGVGSVAEHLDQLYGFAYAQLVEAGLDGRRQRVDDVISVLTPVRDAWNQAVCGLEPVD